MELVLKKYFWAVNLLVLTICAVLAAKAVNHVVEGKFLIRAVPEAQAAAPPPPPPAAEEPVRSKSPEELVTRNIFCQECTPAVAPPPVPGGPVVDPNTPIPTTLPLTLVATSVALGEKNEALSSATIVNTQTNFVGSFWHGEDIPNAGTIEKIQPLYVDFRNASTKRLERVSLMNTAPPPAVADTSAPPVVAPTPPAGGDEFAELGEGNIREVGPNQYEIDRSLVDKVLANPTLIARSARIVPSIKDGKANGFKLYAIRPNSVYAKLGLKNGDTLHAINGFEISSPDKALEVYTKVKSATHLSIQVGRRGKTETLNYRIK